MHLRGPGGPEGRRSAPQETSDKSVVELQQYARKNKPNLHILSKLQEEMRRLAAERVRVGRASGPSALAPREEGAPSCGHTGSRRGKTAPRNLSLQPHAEAAFRHPESPLSQQTLGLNSTCFSLSFVIHDTCIRSLF